MTKVEFEKLKKDAEKQAEKNKELSEKRLTEDCFTINPPDAE